MSKLKIEDISAELQKQNWRLISETYKNLDTDLEMMCPNGHKVFMCLKKWRRHQDCPICNKAHIVKNLSINPHNLVGINPKFSDFILHCKITHN